MLVSLMAGKISVDSRAGRGTTFHVVPGVTARIPRHQNADDTEDSLEGLEQEFSN